MSHAEPDKDWVSVYLAPDEWQAEMARLALVENGIPAVTQSLMIPGFSVLTAPQEGGWGDVLVPPDQETTARDFLEAFLERTGDETNDSAE